MTHQGKIFGSAIVLVLCGALLPAPVDGSTPEKEVKNTKFHAELLAAAKDYAKLDRVEYRKAFLNWGPTLCTAPPIPPENTAFSKSKDEDTHGQKLYMLFMRDVEQYLKLPEKQPVGQVIVKESWKPREAKDDKPKPEMREIVCGEDKIKFEWLPYAQKDGKLFRAGEQLELFIMLKLDPKTPDTDEGWVYGTVTPDGSKVTSAGKLDSCMKCHQEAKADRMFGLKR